MIRWFFIAVAVYAGYHWYTSGEPEPPPKPEPERRAPPKESSVNIPTAPKPARADRKENLPSLYGAPKPGPEPRRALFKESTANIPTAPRPEHADRKENLYGTRVTPSTCAKDKLNGSWAPKPGPESRRALPKESNVNIPTAPRSERTDRKENLPSIYGTRVACAKNTLNSSGAPKPWSEPRRAPPKESINIPTNDRPASAVSPPRIWAVHLKDTLNSNGAPEPGLWRRALSTKESTINIPSAPKPAGANTSPSPSRTCVVCLEDTMKFVRMPCDHFYCVSCLCELFEHATKDESLMPPRCCRQEILLSSVASHLPADLRDRFKRKLKEHNTPNRLYCTKPLCTAFIGSAAGRRRTLQCLDCFTLVCTSCKESHSPGTTCKEDNEMGNTLEFCHEQGWQRCPSCQRMIDRSHGCHRMKCPCGTKFCYLCRSLWEEGGCSCTQRDDHRLRLKAEARVREEICRAGSNTVLPAQVNNHFEARVDAKVEHLRNSDCQHSEWSCEIGAATCEYCFHRLDAFILICIKCAMKACLKCQRNRL